jgi:DNA-directed RNA polymerase subunit RPC12/RpoP
VNLICANCGHNGIETGEAGARSRCARCGHTRFVEAKPATAVAPLPKSPPVRVPGARQWFDQMHAVTDAAWKESHESNQ